MKVAIIGAGIAGLSCAHELERHKIYPTIYERNSYIGEQASHVGAWLGIMERPIRDPLKYVSQEYHLDIQPINTINTLITHTPNHTITAKGNLGYLIKRDKDPLDIKQQIFSKLKNTQVRFNELGDYETLKSQNDFVVIADGTSEFAKELGCFNQMFNGFVRGGVILGSFNPNTLISWVNKTYCKDGYVYLTPFNKKKAFLGLVVSDVNEMELEHYWELFKSTENIKRPFIEEFTQQHISGFVYPHTVENILLAGNAGGALSHFLGFGVINSIIMGVMSAKAIAQGLDYETLLKDYTAKNKQKYQLRRSLNMLNNKDLDRISSILKLPLIKHLIYNTPFDVIKHGADMIKFFTKSY